MTQANESPATAREAILELLGLGLSGEQIARRVGVPKVRLAAITAHVTMGRLGHRMHARSSS